MKNGMSVLTFSILCFTWFLARRTGFGELICGPTFLPGNEDPVVPVLLILFVIMVRRPLTVFQFLLPSL